MKALTMLLFATIACTDSPGRAGTDSVRVAATALEVAQDSAMTTADSADSNVVLINGPTLLAFYPAVTQAQVDTSEELTTVFDDFSYHLSTAADSLRALGVKVEERPVGQLRFIEAGEKRQFMPAKDSSDFGYLFLAPRRAMRVHYGVMTNTDLVQSAREYLESKP